jgi:hypothetical protein
VALDPWPSAGFDALARDAQGGLVPTAAWWRLQFARPELALVPESCAAERALHAALHVEPLQAVAPAQLARLADADARENWQAVLHWRTRVLEAGTLEAAYRAQFARGVDVAPVFIDAMAEAILRALLDDCDDALAWRSAEMLFRPQRCSVVEGRLVAGDRDTLDLLNRDDSAGGLGALLRQAGAAPRAVQLEVLTPEHGAAYFAQASRHRFLLDLTTQITRDGGHGVSWTLSNARSAQKGLATVLERWVARLLGVRVRVQPLSRIDTTDWRWHVGLDAEATALLNALYEDHEVDDERMPRIVALFRLEFADAAAVQPALAGHPVYLGAAMDASGLLRLKPQNLLTGLPLAPRN